MSIRILIADDDPEDLEMLEEAFLEVKPDSNIDTVIGGAAAIKWLDTNAQESLPNLIVLDFNMPDVNGIDVLSHIQAKVVYNSVPRVMFSTSNAEKYISDSLEHGATRYFVKPQTKRELDAIAVEMLSLASRS